MRGMLVVSMRACGGFIALLAWLVWVILPWGAVCPSGGLHGGVGGAALLGEWHVAKPSADVGVLCGCLTDEIVSNETTITLSNITPTKTHCQRLV